MKILKNNRMIKWDLVKNRLEYFFYKKSRKKLKIPMISFHVFTFAFVKLFNNKN